MHNFRELNIWKLGMQLARTVYEASSKFPSEEKFNLTRQVRRSSVSIPSNIAEGSSRKSNKEFQHFLSISIGSLFELETRLCLACELSFIEEGSYKNLEGKIVELQKMIYGFSNSLSS